MTAMPASGECFHSGNVTIDAAGVVRRGWFRGKSRVVPMVLFSTLLMVTGGLVVTGGEGAQAASAVGTLVQPPPPAPLPVNPEPLQTSVIGVVYTDSRTDIEIHVKEPKGGLYLFYGLINGVKKSLKGTIFKGELKTENFQRLMEKTKSFSYVRTGPQEMTFTFFDDYINEVKGNELGSIVVERLSNGSNLSELLPGPGIGFGRWGGNTVDIRSVLEEMMKNQ